jgi:hypothetical protein
MAQPTPPTYWTPPIGCQNRIHKLGGLFAAQRRQWPLQPITHPTPGIETFRVSGLFHHRINLPHKAFQPHHPLRLLGGQHLIVLNLAHHR